jgi:hypothetical protein
MKPTCLIAATLVAIAVVCTALILGPTEALTLLAFGALGMAGFATKDAQLTKTKALPNGAATTNSDPIDLGATSRSDFVADHEVLISAPALTTTELADTQTIKYTLEHDSDSAFGGAATVPGFADVITQTGAGGAGAAAATHRGKLPTNVKRFIRLKQVKTGASNASTSSGKVEVLT